MYANFWPLSASWVCFATIEDTVWYWVSFSRWKMVNGLRWGPAVSRKKICIWLATTVNENVLLPWAPAHGFVWAEPRVWWVSTATVTVCRWFQRPYTDTTTRATPVGEIVNTDVAIEEPDAQPQTLLSQPLSLVWIDTAAGIEMILFSSRLAADEAAETSLSFARERSGQTLQRL